MQLCLKITMEVAPLFIIAVIEVLWDFFLFFWDVSSYYRRSKVVEIMIGHIVF